MLIGWGSWSQRAARVSPRANVEVAPNATHGEGKVPSPDQKSFHICTTPTNQGPRRRSHGSIPPHKVWKPLTEGTRLLSGVREASGPHPMGGRSSASSLTVIECTPICFHHGVVVRSTWISTYVLRLAQPKKKKQGAYFCACIIPGIPYITAVRAKQTHFARRYFLLFRPRVFSRSLGCGARSRPA